MFIKVGGVRGAGKTRISGVFTGFLQQQGFKAELINGAQLIADELGISKNGLALLEEQERKNARLAAYRRLYERDRQIPRIRIRDGHFVFVNKDDNGCFEISTVDLVPEDKEQLKTMFLLEPPLAVVLQRRLNDLQIRTDRNLGNLELLREEQKWERQIAEEQASKLGLNLKILANDGSEQDTNNQMYEHLRKTVPDLESYRQEVQTRTSKPEFY